MPEIAKKTIEINVSVEVKAVCLKHAKAVHAEFAGAYVQSKNAVAASRSLREILDGEPLPLVKEDKALLNKVQQALYFHGNASAVRQLIEGKKSSAAAETASEVFE